MSVRGFGWVGVGFGAVVMLGAVSLSVLAAQAPAAAALETAVPVQYRELLAGAAAECPQVSAAVLAAQLQTESGFDPNAVSPAGALGIAQFMPATWARWGRDVDGNGTASPFDPADAIDAQARYMCDLYDRAVTSGIAADPLLLALAAYNAGWGAVTASRGIPAVPETEAYVARVAAAAAQLAAAAAGTARATGHNTGGPFPDGAVLPRDNPRGPGQAIAWASAQATGPASWYRRCAAFVAAAYGWRSSGADYALDHWRRMPAGLRHAGETNPPPGALLFWGTGTRAGHVALAVGNGLIATNDVDAPGAISVVPAEVITERWGARYLGWTAPYFPRAG